MIRSIVNRKATVLMQERKEGPWAGFQYKELIFKGLRLSIEVAWRERWVKSRNNIYMLYERGRPVDLSKKNLALIAIAEACRLMFNGVSLCE